MTVNKAIRRFRKHFRPILGSALVAWGGATKSLATLSKGLQRDSLSYRAIRGMLKHKKRDVDVTDRLFHAIKLIAGMKSPAGSVIFDLVSNSESQLGQDMFAALAYGLKRDGYFVEVGVGQGKAISNTYMLEKHFGWRGLLVEPSRSFHDSIKKQRSARLDVRAATSRDHDEITFNEAVGAGEFSYVENAKTKSQERQSTKKFISYSVPTATLDTMLAAANAPDFIEFLSLDTEGSELDILKGLDLKRYRVGVLCIEHNFRPGMISSLDAQLVPHGYERVLAEVSEYDAWYVHQSIKTEYF